MSDGRAIRTDAFRSLASPNFRLLLIGQALSQSGVWIHTVTTAVVVLELSDSGLVLGLATAAQFLPMLLLGPWGGVLSDRFDRRRIIVWTQVVALVVATAMAGVVLTDRASLPVVFALTVAIGTVNAIETPARIALAGDLVPREDITNAIALNSSILTGCRVVGPILAGVLVAGPGAGWCFAVHAASKLPQIHLVLRMDPRTIRQTTATGRGRGQIRDGLAHVWERASLRVPLLLMAVTALFAFNYNIVLPLLSERTFDAGPTGYTILFASMSAGSVVGGLAMARRATVDLRYLAIATIAMGIAYVVLAGAPTLVTAAVLAFPVGYFYLLLGAGTNSTVQINSDPDMRGRAVALVPIISNGLTPVGGPVAGWLADTLGVRAAVALCGIPCVIAGLLVLTRWREAGTEVDVALEPPPL